jgi:hypothetical protein
VGGASPQINGMEGWHICGCYCLAGHDGILVDIFARYLFNHDLLSRNQTLSTLNI